MGNDIREEQAVTTLVPRRYQRRHWGMTLRAWWHRIATGGFFPSAVAAAVGAASALTLQVLELRYSAAWCAAMGPLERLCEIPVDTSVSIQAGVALGILGTVGIVFSILLVSLQLVSGQFSPRLVQAIFRDKKSKALVAILVAVFVFSMTALFATLVLAGQGAAAGLNTALVGLAGVVAGVALVMMLYGVAQRQYIGAILDDAADATIDMIKGGTRRRRGSHVCESVVPSSALDDMRNFPEALGRVHWVTSRRSGWVQQLTSDALLEVAPDNCVIQLETRVGAFIPEGAPLASVWPVVGRPGREELTSAEIRRLDSDVNLTAYVGTTRTMQDDADFGLRQITDVFLRAMSAAVNDPSTAIEALMRTSTVLRTIITSRLPAQIEHDEQRGVTIMRPWDLDAGEYMRHGLDQVRLVAADQPTVAIAVLRVMTHLIETAQAEVDEAAGLSDELARRSRMAHLRLALDELNSQRDDLLTRVNQAGYSEKDISYVLTGIRPQRPDLVERYRAERLLASTGSYETGVRS